MTKMLMISADGHVNPRPTEYAGLLEEKYRDGVDALIEQSRLFTERTWPVARDAKAKAIVDPLNETDAVCKEGVWNPHKRLADLERDGFVAEILFPGDPSSIGLYFMNTSEPVCAEYRAAGVRAYNRWLTEYCSAAPNRLLGVAQTEPWPDFDACIRQVEQAKRDGMVGVAPPRFPGIEANQPPFTDPIWDRFWAACADNDLTVCFHIGHLHPQGGLLDSMVQNNTRETGFTDNGADGSIIYDPGRRPFWQMVMAGVFDRYPKLRVTFSEIRTDWVAPTLAHMESRYEEARFSGRGASLPKLRPTEYWLRNCGISHMLNPFDVAMRHQIGVETMMFAVDYPHIEGSWPNSREWLRLALKGVSETEARMILGGNVTRYYNIDVASLLPLADRFGLDTAEVLGDHDVSREFVDSFAYRSIFFNRSSKYDPTPIDKIMDEDQAAVLQPAR